MGTCKLFKMLAMITAMYSITAFAPKAQAAARSVHVDFVNQSDSALIRVSDNLSHGCWTNEPPLRIEASSTVSWESESCGIATGTEGEVTYAFETGSSAHFHWDNPFIGSNSYDESVPVAFSINRSGGDGNNASVTWVLNCSSRTCDGIPDDWKIHGVTIDPGDGSGPQFIDLPKMGATVNTPDIFVQLDWMADTTHSHKLDPTAIQTIVTAFQNSPFISRTGSVGIHLHVDQGPDSIMDFSTNATWDTLSRAKQQTEATNLGTLTATGDYDWTAFDNIKNAPGGFRSTGRSAIFRYSLAAHQIATLGNSGIARGIPGSDFIVSLGAFGSPVVNWEAGTFMHELGHNLGLGHGGSDGVNFKPNYLSVMNYAFQLNGLTKNGTANVFDYSFVKLDTLDEANLDETTGVGAAAARIATSHWCPASGVLAAGFVTVADASQPIDWNCNGTPGQTNVIFDVNNDNATSSLSSFDDWQHIKFKGGAIGVGTGAQQPVNTGVDEITPEIASRVQPVDSIAPVTVAVITPPPNAAGWNRSDVTVSLVATDNISGVVRTDQGLDGAGLSPSSGPVFINAEGIHTLAFRSIDRAQNVEPTKQVTVRLDKTPPDETLTIGLPQYAGGPPTIISSMTPLTINASDSGSGLTSVAFRFFLQGGTPTAFTTQSSNTVQFNLTGPDGFYEVDAVATDVAGNARTVNQIVHLTNSADLAIASLTALNSLPRFVVVGTPVPLSVRTVLTDLGLVAPADTVLTRTLTGTGNVTLSPATPPLAEPALGLNEQRAVDQGYTVTCVVRSSNTITFTSRIALDSNAGTIVDPNPANNTAQLSLPVVCKVPWKPGVTYRVGDEVVFNGLVYLARQQHTSQIGWEPPNVYALWQRDKADTGGVWAPQVIYQSGDVVLFQGHHYKCIQGHQSQPGWEPSVVRVPALWQKLD